MRNREQNDSYVLQVNLAGQQGWTCHYCDARLVASLLYYHVTRGNYQRSDKTEMIVAAIRDGARMATVDHKIPHSRSGTDAPENLVLACWECNIEKSDGDYETFMCSKGKLPTAPRPEWHRIVYAGYKKWSQRAAPVQGVLSRF